MWFGVVVNFGWRHSVKLVTISIRPCPQASPLRCLPSPVPMLTSGARWWPAGTAARVEEGDWASQAREGNWRGRKQTAASIGNLSPHFLYFLFPSFPLPNYLLSPSKIASHLTQVITGESAVYLSIHNGKEERFGLFRCGDSPRLGYYSTPDATRFFERPQKLELTSSLFDRTFRDILIMWTHTN